MYIKKAVSSYLAFFALAAIAAFAVPYATAMAAAYCIIPLSSSLIGFFQLSSETVISVLIWTLFHSSDAVIAVAIHMLILYVIYKLGSIATIKQSIFYIAIFMITPLVFGLIYYPQDIWIFFEGYKYVGCWIPVFAAVLATYILRRKRLLQ